MRTDEATIRMLDGLEPERGNPFAGLQVRKRLFPNPVPFPGSVLTDAQRLETDPAYKEAQASDESPNRLPQVSVGDCWTAWYGGENPVPGAVVDVLFRVGPVGQPEFSESLIWQHRQRSDGIPPCKYDIVAYRVVWP